MNNTLQKIPEYISKLLEIGMMNWDTDQMEQFTKWQTETDSFPKEKPTPRESQKLPCFWHKRGIVVNACH